jgi:hypothetical protein
VGYHSPPHPSAASPPLDPLHERLKLTQPSHLNFFDADIFNFYETNAIDA